MKTGHVVPVGFVNPRLDASTPYALEALEPRRLMSAATVTLGDDGVLLIQGTDGRDCIALGYSARDGSLCVNIMQHGTAAGWMWQPDDLRLFFDGSRIHEIRVEAGGGDDAIFCTSVVDEGVFRKDFNIPLYADGGAGDDTIGGTACADTLIGGAGDDWIDGDSSSDRLGIDLENLVGTVRDNRYAGLSLPTGPSLNDKGQGDLIYADDIPAPAAAASPAPQAEPEVAMPVAMPPATPSGPMSSLPSFFHDDENGESVLGGGA